MHLYFTVGTLERDAGDAEGCALRSLRAVLLRGLHGHAHIHQSQCRWADERVLCVTTVSLARQPDTNCCCSLPLSLFFFSRSHFTVPQTGPPSIKFRKRTPFAIGEKLFALCNTTRGRPAPHITWLINGKKVRMRDICQSIHVRLCVWVCVLWWLCDCDCRSVL